MNKKRVMIVEDDQAIRSILRAELEKSGFAVIEAANGEDAMILLSKERPGIILLDVLMPKMHGIDMLYRLRELEWGKTIPVILLTNYAGDPRVIQAVKAGHCECMSKADSRLQDVVSRVKEMLS